MCASLLLVLAYVKIAAYALLLSLILFERFPKLAIPNFPSRAQYKVGSRVGCRCKTDLGRGVMVSRPWLWLCG